MTALAAIAAELAEQRPAWALRWLDEAELRGRSHGRIANAYGINRRTRKPERGSVMCCRIFGPVETLTCLCTKHAGEEDRGVTCDRCGVLVTDATVRGERLGHLELPPGLVHPWAPERPLGVLAVLPAGLREAPEGVAREELPGTSGLYQRLIRRIERLERCVQHCAPSVIVEHETALAQRALARLLGVPRRIPGRGPTLAEGVQRIIYALGPGDALPRELHAALAAVGTAATPQFS